MFANNKPYTKEEYKKCILIRAQRKLIIKALIRTKGNMREAHKLLCPTNTPFAYNHMYRVLKKHSISLIDFKDEKRVLDKSIIHKGKDGINESEGTKIKPKSSSASIC